MADLGVLGERLADSVDNDLVARYSRRSLNALVPLDPLRSPIEAGPPVRRESSRQATRNTAKVLKTSLRSPKNASRLINARAASPECSGFSSRAVV